MQVFRLGSDYVIRLDPGEEIVDSVTAFCQTVDIPAASVSGIGAVSACEIGRYALSEKRFVSKAYEGEFEIIALNGNITKKDGEPYVHLHLALADEALNVHGGHLTSGVVSLTAEIVIKVLAGTLERSLHEETGINRLAEP